jgi:MerR family transcriptional regulator, light-induced transcriptional regulator
MDDTDGLTIGELARRTGVAAATLRSWEARHGFPRPRRLAGGHRRYDRDDTAVIAEVLAQRAAGLSLPAAITQATTGPAPVTGSVFAAVSRQHPSLQPQVLGQTALLALSRAIEDEYCARATRAVLFASFQQQNYFERSEQRWLELARTAIAVVVFADFTAPASARPGLVKIPLPAGAPLQREWALVCAARDYPVCLAGWEIPAQGASRPQDRRFEVVWSLDPRVVADAAAACAQLAESLHPGLRLTAHLPTGPLPPASADLQHATSLITRMATYLDNYPR